MPLRSAHESHFNCLGNWFIQWRDRRAVWRGRRADHGACIRGFPGIASESRCGNIACSHRSNSNFSNDGQLEKRTSGQAGAAVDSHWGSYHRDLHVHETQIPQR